MNRNINVYNTLPLWNSRQYFSIPLWMNLSLQWPQVFSEPCLPLSRVWPAARLQTHSQRCALWENEPGSGQVLVWVSQGHFLKSIHSSIQSQPGGRYVPIAQHSRQYGGWKRSAPAPSASSLILDIESANAIKTAAIQRNTIQDRSYFKHNLCWVCYGQF